MRRLFRSTLSRKISTDTSSPQYEHLFRSTSGRWLWNEEKELDARYRKFNVEELKRIAATSVGATSCVSISKLAEGGYNKVLKLRMDNGCVAIARIPYPNACPSNSIASEVATMEFARTILDIPVPKVYAWSAVPHNPVEAEYIVMEEAKGTSLADAWDKIELDAKDQVIASLVAIEKKLLSVSFNWHGNIYFKEHAFPGCEKAEITGDVSVELQKQAAERFTIGPVVQRRTPCAYLRAVADYNMKWLNQHAVPKSALSRSFSINDKSSDAQNSPSAHIALYEKFISISPFILPEDERMTRSTLWHGDMHAPNIFVKDNKITSLIDWQSTWARPLFLQYHYPKRVKYTGDVMLSYPEEYESLEKVERDKVTNRVEISLVQYLYETETQTQNPLLVDVSDVPHGTTRQQTVEFGEDSWEGDILPFRQCLIRLERHWNDMGHDLPCPIHFTDADIQGHLRDGEGWNEQADFWEGVAGVVARDGWTPNDMYHEAREMFVKLRAQGLEQLEGRERDKFEQQTRWARGDGLSDATYM